MTKKLRVGSRRSALAIAQANIVIAKLKAGRPEFVYEVSKIATEGDEDYREELGTPTSGKDAFTKRIEQKLLSGEIDIAVHSLKDLPSKLHPELVIAATPEREDPRDSLISVKNLKLFELPEGARVGTSSLRRKVQLLAARPDIEVVEIHGNIGTRIRKINENGLDAIVLAVAGLTRLGLSNYISEVLDFDIMLPAIGQGALAVEVRRNDRMVEKVVGSIEDPNTRLATEAERAFSERLGGGCNLPLGGYGEVRYGTINLRGVVASADGRKVIREEATGSADNPRGVGGQLAEKMLSLGATEIIGVRL